MARTVSSEADWHALWSEANETFSPGAPIRERDLFVGRIDQVRSLLDSVQQPGRHAVVFGERGVGKTSLANTFALGLNSPTNRVIAQKINADPTDTFSTLWNKVFKRLRYEVVDEDGVPEWRIIADDYSGLISPDDIQLELSAFGLNVTPIVIVDEYDRIGDQETRMLMSDTIKSLADYVVNCTIIIVGVAEDVGSLIGSHESIGRQLIQIRMPRMNQEELNRIVLDRITRLGMRISDDALWRITFLSRGLPYYSHLLGMHAVRAAIIARELRVTEEHLESGLQSALAEVDQTLKERYAAAVISKKPAKDTLYEPVLLACALAENDELGRFQQKDVQQPLSAIITSRVYKATTYAFHMNEFCEQRRGAILENLGEEQTPRYRFRDPMMQPYVVLRGLADKRIDGPTMERFIPQRQRQLPIDS